MPQLAAARAQGARGSVDWSHYKHLLPEHVYDVYLRIGGTCG
ncbi:MAG: hypothetical protein ACXV3U_07925 [Halobacteriota archaeon]